MIPRFLTLYFRNQIERKETTSRLFSEVLGNYEIFISELVLAEIKATPDSTRRNKLLESVSTFQVVSISSEAETLSSEYLKYLKIPEADALHIAIATVEGMNYLATWNMRHIAGERTKRVVDNTNFLSGFPRIYIVTPDDFFE